VCHLGNIALRCKEGQIVWDPVKEQIISGGDAAAMLTKEYRKPWTLG
jgi:hypothetical protein